MSLRGRRGVSSRADFDALSAADQERYGRALEVVQLVRNNGYRFDKAAASQGLKPSAVLGLVGSAFTMTRGGIVARASDDLYRPVRVWSADGEEMVDLVGSRAAEDAMQYRGAVAAYLGSGDPSHLAPYRGRSLGGVELLTDPERIEELARLGELDTEKFYALP